ncbi:MAG: pyruvate, phosphate dikinase [Bacilli bacterium]|nr:pyruvate, phosphate dikinase [Bacilli bacterium]
MSKKYVYFFNEDYNKIENPRNLLGGKGAGLAEMSSQGFPVPYGFTVTTEACTRYYADGEKIADEIVEQIMEKVEMLENASGKKFGDPKNPLLVSVRSGARISMPGMMDTVLNLGINDEIAKGLAELSGNERFAYDSYRRFIQMYSDVVIGLNKSHFERILDEEKEKRGVTLDTELTAEDLKELVALFKRQYKEEKGEEFPEDPKAQLLEGVKAVFRSWNTERAIYYRKMNGIPHEWGTAVNVQMMAFGNMGENCGTGVAFSRNPSTGENKIYGEFLYNAQGEDVVAGIRTPLSIDKLAERMPQVYEDFCNTAKKLERYYKNMQDMEFTIQDGKLFMLQTRNGKRTATAALQIACDMYDEGLVTKEQALLMVEPQQLDSLLHPTFDAAALKAAKPVGSGLPASPGAGAGKVVFHADDAVALKNAGEKAVLVRLETSPEDIIGMDNSQGILTARGGMTSHAAVVARGMGKCCVAGCHELKVYEEEKYFVLNGHTVKEGDVISLDGSTGNIYLGEIKSVPAAITGNFERIMNWADEVRTLKIRTNADSPKDARQAVEFGAEGIGLCRTEHMFFEADRIKAVREMIVSKTQDQRRAALAKLLPMQRSDFEGIYEAMTVYPVTIRFLDPPLHEFVPTKEEDIVALAAELNVSVDELHATIASLHEFNPMMGHRGCRLSVTYPEIAEMQTRAVIEAAINVNKAHPEYNIVPEIMIPLVGDPKEMKFVKDIVVNVADEIIAASGSNLKYHVGTMIEIPRAALLADEIAKEAEFFSFGTNDLTQMTFGFSRDDAGKFLDAYYGNKIYVSDPFARLDQNGVGKLVEIATKLGRSTRPNLKVGVCGEQGGEPASVEFFHKVGLNYVSCSPYRVPIARLAAAHAAIKNK